MNWTDAPKSTAELTTLMMVSPFVIGTRMTQMWLSAASPTAADKAEVSLMVAEKIQAVGESIVAMNMATMKAVGDATIAAMSGRARHVNDADAILSAGLQVYSKKVRANRKRLSR
ncbi:hypothetical protein [Antarcticirhabdus aurantiaca]|uniref:Uncharacterized protein n=1 Tax=Antarcticirhabdus aurantiaca TaxID=2606717 RepID=A0ACD4NUR5_9HYPH|nr:hypothetical protein [Antarcticirhabdus aurantiaca]WAJ30569.1 hypothetical protein OXU80_10335 [Jeongeuplla avenae]